MKILGHFWGEGRGGILRMKFFHKSIFLIFDIICIISFLDQFCGVDKIWGVFLKYVGISHCRYLYLCVYDPTPMQTGYMHVLTDWYWICILLSYQAPYIYLFDILSQKHLLSLKNINISLFFFTSIFSFLIYMIFTHKYVVNFTPTNRFFYFFACKDFKFSVSSLWYIRILLLFYGFI